MYSTSELDELFQILNSIKGFKLNNHKGATQHQGTQANQQVQVAATDDSSQLESLLLSTLAANDSGPPQVNYDTEQSLTVSTPSASSTSTHKIQATDAYHQIIPGMSECLYPTLVADGSLSTPTVDDCSTLHRQITSELDKYLQETAEKRAQDDNYYDGQHMSTNTSNSQQEANFLEEDNDAGSAEELNKPIALESHEQDTGAHHDSPPEYKGQPHDEIDTIPEEEEEEEEPQTDEQPDPADQDTLVLTSKESDEEPSNTAIAIPQMTQPSSWVNQLQLHSSPTKYAFQPKR